MESVVGTAARYFERIGDAVNASIAYDMEVELNPEWETLVKAGKAYVRLYTKLRDPKLLRKAREWLEKALFIKEDKEVLYYLALTSILAGKVEEADKYMEGLEEELFATIEVAVEERKRKWEKAGISKLQDPLLIRLFSFLSRELKEVDAERMEALYKEIVERNALNLKDANSKIGALIYLLVRGDSREEREKLRALIRDGHLNVEGMPPFTRKLVERFLHRSREKPIPFYLQRDLEELNQLGERLAKLEGNIHKEYGELMERIRERIKAFKRKASLVLPKEQVKEVLKLYIATLPIEEEEKFNLLDLL